MSRHDEFEPWSPDPRPGGSDAEQLRQPPPAEVDSSPSPVRADSLDIPDADTTSRSHNTILTGRDGAETRLTAHVTEEERSRVREELTAIIESQRKARHQTSSQLRPNARSASMTDPSQLDAALTNVLGRPDKPTSKPQTVGRQVGRGEASRGASLQGLRGRSRSASIMAKEIYAADPLDPRWEREKHRLLKASSERLIRGSLEHHFELLAARRNGFSPTRLDDSESPDRASDAAAAASLADLAAGEEVPEGNNSPLGSKTPRTKQRQKAAVAEKAGKVREMFERQLALVRDAEREKMLSAQQASERNMRQFSHHVDALLRGVQEATALINTPAVTQDADGHLTAEQQRGHRNVHALEREHPSISASLAHGKVSDDDEPHVQDGDDENNHDGKVGEGFQAPDTQDGVEARLQALSSALHQLLTVAFSQYDRVACGRCDQSIETAVAAPLFVETTDGRRAVDVSDAALIRVLRGEVLEGDGSILSMSPGQLSPGGLQTPCSATAANADRLSEMLRLAELEVHAKTLEAQKHQRRAEESVKAVIAAERAREAMKIKLSTAEASRDQAIEEASMLEESLRLERSSMGQGSPYSPHSPQNIRSPLMSSIRRGASGLLDDGDHSPHMLSPDHSRVVHTGGDHDHDQDLGDDDGGDDCGGEEVPSAVRDGVSMEELSEADRDQTDSSLQRSPPPPPMPTQQEPRHVDDEAPQEAMKSPESDAMEADGDVEGSRVTADPTAPYQRDTTCEGRTSATLREDSQAPVAAELFAPNSVGPDAPDVHIVDEGTTHQARQAQDTEESPVAARAAEQAEHDRSGTDELVDVEPAASQHHGPSADDLSSVEEMYRARHAVSMSCTEAVVSKLEIANDGLSALLGDYHSLVTDTFGALPAATTPAEEVTGPAAGHQHEESAPALGTSHRHLALPLQEALPPPEALPSDNDRSASPTAAAGDEASPYDGTMDDEKSPPATSRNHSATEQPARSRPSRNEAHRAGETDRALESPTEREAALASEVEELKARCEETESVLAAVLRRLGTIHELSDVPGQPLPVPEALQGLLSSGMSSRAPSSAALKHVSTDDI